MIPVIVKSLTVQGKVPLAASLTFYYKETSDHMKKIISASVNFWNYVLPQSKIKSYNLTIILQPCGHTELTIFGGFDLFYYFFMNALAGMVCLIVTIPWFIWHRIFTRAKNFSFVFFEYLSVVLKPATVPVLMTCLLLFFYLTTVGFVFLHKFMSFQFPAFTCEDSSKCIKQTIWDIFMPSDFISVEKTNFRNMRFGVILIQAGVIVIHRISNLLILDFENDPISEQKMSFDDNIFHFKNLRRINFYYLIIVYIMYELWRIHFAFSNFFETNILQLLMVFKIIMILLEFLLKNQMFDQMQIAFFESSLLVWESVIFAGSRDYLEFFIGQFVNIGILLNDRAYMAGFTDYATDYMAEKVEDWYDKIKVSLQLEAQIIKDKEKSNDSKKKIYPIKSTDLNKPKKQTLEKNEIREENRLDETQNIIQEDTQKENSEENDEIESFYSEILLSDEGFKGKVMKQFKKELEENNENELEGEIDHKSLLKQNRGKQYEKKRPEFNFNAGIPKFDIVEDNFKKEFATSNRMNEKKSKSRRKKKRDEEYKERFEMLEKYFPYSCDSMVLLLSPLIYWIIWAFYNEIGLARNFRISYSSFSYYVLYFVVYIPFQLAIDFLGYNQLHLYNYINSHLSPHVLAQTSQRMLVIFSSNLAISDLALMFLDDRFFHSDRTILSWLILFALNALIL